MRARLGHSYNKLIEKYPIFMWPRLNERNNEDVGELDLKVSESYFISDPTHWCKALHKPIFYLAINPKKWNLIGDHMYDALHLKKYWVWDHKQQRAEYFNEPNKLMTEPLHHIFCNQKFFMHGSKQNAFFPINWLKRMKIELLIKMIIGTKIILSCMVSEEHLRP